MLFRSIMKANFQFYFQPSLILAMFLRKRGSNFVLLPEYWFFKPLEIYKIGKVGLNFLINLVVTILPEKISEIIYILVVGNKNINKPRRRISSKIINPINTEMKNIKLEKKAVPPNIL